VLVVGAGPSGLLLALLLAKQGIQVKVLEKSNEFDKQPRASFYSLPAIHELKRAGVFDEVSEKAYHANGVSWRYIDGTRIASIRSEDAPPEAKMVSMPLDELIPLIAKYLEKESTAEILLSHEVLASGQSDDHAWVDVKTPDGEKRFTATYLVGADGGSSKIRHDLFGKNFPGRTWDKQIVATNVYYPGLKKYNWDTSSNFMIHPEHFPMVAQMTNDGLLRVTYGEKADLTREEMLARQPEKYKAFLPGSPDPSEYKLINFSPYKIHQRLAEKLRVGRIILVADAAHLCNPL
jgi:2-polyprenyl-6-methoxyphenol hydroxylase-like FAD-dependent oxidoreductase